MKKIFLMVTAIMLLIMPVYAEENIKITSEMIIEPYFTNIYTFHTYFDIDGNGKAELAATLDGHNGDTSRIEAQLQRYSNGNWSTIKSFSSTSSTSNCSLSTNYYVAKGYSYRVIYYAYIYNGPILLDHTSQISALHFY